MRKISPGLSLAFVFALLGCGGAGVSGGASAPETLPVAAAASSIPGEDDADAAIRETVDLSKDKWIELEASPGTPALIPGAKAIAAKDWRAARRSLEAALGALQDAPIDQQFAGLALLGRACDFLKDRKEAEKAYGAILDVWKGETTVRAAIESAGDDPVARRKAVQRVLLSVGEALYFMAEEKRDDAEDLKAPGYTGIPTKANVQKFLSERVDSWTVQKQALLAEAEGAYAKIASLEPMPPPQLLVRFAARVGLMRARFVAELRAAPAPTTWFLDGRAQAAEGRTWSEVRAQYYRELDVRAVAFEAPARAACLQSQRVAARFAVAEPLARSCAQWLVRNP